MVDIDGLVEIANSDNELRFEARLEQMTPEELRESLAEAVLHVAHLRPYVMPEWW